MPETDKTNVTLESLLRLKRSERPGPEFWDGFDRDWNARRLRALIPPAPWYVRWRRPVLRVSAALVPVGAAAAAVIWLQVSAPNAPVGAFPDTAAVQVPLAASSRLVVSAPSPVFQGPLGPEVATGESVFILDSLQPDVPRAAYAKVLASTDLRFDSGSGGRYVSDGLVAAAPVGALFSVEF